MNRFLIPFLFVLFLQAAMGCGNDPPPKPCRKARVTATLAGDDDPLPGRRGKSDILIQLGKRATSACENSDTCTREIPVDGNTVDVVLTDIDVLFHDEIGRTSGVSIPSSQVKVGRAKVDIVCVE